VEREITLRDYGRVLWRGRWVLLIAAVAAGLLALVLSLARQTNYTAQSVVYMGVATTARSNQVVPTPFTTPVTALKVLRSDTLLKQAAEGAGVDLERVRDGVSFSVERVPGAAGGNVPTVATISYVDESRDTAIDVVNAYADAVFGTVAVPYEKVIAVYDKLVKSRQDRITQIQGDLDRLRGQGAAGLPIIASLNQELALLVDSAEEAELGRAKAEIIERPYVVTEAVSASSSARPGERLRSVIFGTLIGLILGAVVTFIWKGSPAADD
jgi:hypothetical protein